MWSLNRNRFGSCFLPGPLDFPSLHLGHRKLAGTSGSYSVSLSAQCPAHSKRIIEVLKVVSAVVLDPLMAVKL